MVDSFLEQLTSVTKEDEQLDILSGFFDLCTPGTHHFLPLLNFSFLLIFGIRRNSKSN